MSTVTQSERRYVSRGLTNWTFLNGTNAENSLGSIYTHSDGGSTFSFYTDSDSAIGIHNTVMRNCFRDYVRQVNLIETYLTVDVKQNYPPDFVSEVQTYFNMSDYGIIEYKLPAVTEGMHPWNIQNTYRKNKDQYDYVDNKSFPEEDYKLQRT